MDARELRYSLVELQLWEHFRQDRVVHPGDVEVWHRLLWCVACRLTHVVFFSARCWWYQLNVICSISISKLLWNFLYYWVHSVHQVKYESRWFVLLLDGFFLFASFGRLWIVLHGFSRATSSCVVNYGRQALSRWRACILLIALVRLVGLLASLTFPTDLRRHFIISKEVKLMKNMLTDHLTTFLSSGLLLPRSRSLHCCPIWSWIDAVVVLDC